MPGQRADEATRGLGAEPGLCASCQHAKINETRRGTAYLRCTRAAWDTRLSRYPRLPVTQCVGFDPAARSPGAQQQGGRAAGGGAPGERGDEVGRRERRRRDQDDQQPADGRRRDQDDQQPADGR